MIRWCAYCQKYLGESAPFDQFELTHGICKDCLATNRLQEVDEVRVRGVATFLQKVAECMARDQLATALLEEGLQLGLQPWDLLIGIIQPVLRNMGEKWASAEATIHQEAQLTASCSRIIALLWERQPGFKALGQAPRPEVLLVNAEGNRHHLGIGLVQFFLLTRGIPARALHAPMPPAELLEVIQECRPRKVGISCAVPGQIPAAGRAVAAIATLPQGLQPQVYVGGNGVRGNEASLLGWPCRICAEPADLLDPPRIPANP